MVDNRVSIIVGRYLPPRARLARALRLCPLGAAHMLQPSYGQTTRHTVGQVFELCLGEERCRYHCSLLAKQMSPRDRRNCFEELANLAPPGYSEDTFDRFCAEQATAPNPSNIEPGAWRLLFPASPSRRRGRSSTLGQIATPRVNAGTGTQATRSVGRPSLRRRSVSVFVYLRDHCQPLMVIVEGLYNEGVTTFRLAQDKIKNALAADPDGGDRYLLPGEGRVYRKRGVSAMPNFEGYASVCLPLCECAIPWLPGDAGPPLLLREDAPSTSHATSLHVSPATSSHAIPATSSHAIPATSLHAIPATSSHAIPTTSSHTSSLAKRTGTVSAEHSVKRRRVEDIAVPHAGRKGKQVARSLSSMDIIELTDSEDDEAWPSSPSVQHDIIVISDSE
ncbi:uncharacterized protein TRAVEDRAFT_43094 [Trametes versicolor FP-101664 SS1]|uniref:uncharacterized protein n=1 Tax=Trametes versicolor (strain FP-101664) TaxID=717944 RepID=UPI0004622D45|nr:uncharacterized protein TRAVEDRAFT_43094 [Trametes versicolor FP-101664 SS1]EIW62768.1 hypothetical protein TRAVEDRAFT_43094 [Trametes versicolor FP-101664 SS1]